MAVEVAIRVEGLREFSRSLRALDAELPKMLRIAFNKAAGVVVDYGRARMPRRTGAASSTIKAKSTRTSVRVAEGDRRHQYVPWLDFGGRVGRRKSVKRPYIKGGRYLYPALTEKRDDIERAVQDALAEVAEAAGLELS